MNRLVICAALAAVSYAASAQAQQNQPAQDKAGAGAAKSVTVEMMDAKKQSVGTVEIRPLAHGVVFIADLKNLPPGPHGFHVHERGVCEPPGFQSAGGHFNPSKSEHGFATEKGYHAGDLPNIHVNQQGVAKAEFHTTQLTLATGAAQTGAGNAGPFSLLDDDGSAIMVHAKPDDYRDVSSAGDRIACGVIKVK